MSELKFREFLLGSFLIFIVIVCCVALVYLVLLYIQAIIWFGRGYY